MPLINTPLKRTQFYQLDLKGLKSTVAAISWNEVEGKNRLRHFFADANWQNSIVSIGVSSGGAKGGVFFLDVQPAGGGNPIAQYVVKGSPNPGRTIFAEYILQSIGLAKIPKTLALEIDATDPNSEGMAMLNLLLDRNRRRANANQQRFDQSLDFLWDNTTNQPKVPYLVVQKLFGGEQFTAKFSLQDQFDLWVVNEKLAFSFKDPNLRLHFTEPQAVDMITELENQQILHGYGYGSSLSRLSDNFNRRMNLPTTLTRMLGNEAAVKTMLDQVYDTLDSVGLPPTQRVTFAGLLNYLQGQNSPAAQRLFQSLTQFIANAITPAVQTLTSVLTDQTKVRNMGRVLAADSLIGNADRLQGERGANWDNLFIVNKQNRGLNKVDYPVGVIDNDTLMQTYPHPTFNNPGAYINALLNGAVELDVPPGVQAAPTSNLRQLLTNFDAWFAGYFVESLVLHDASYQPIIDQYTQAGFPSDATQGQWPQVRDWLKDGFSSGLQRINNMTLTEMRKLHSSLTLTYGVDSNFDFQALQIRYAYLCAAQINRNNPQQPFTLNHNAVSQQLLNGLTQQQFGVIHPDLQEALNFGVTVNPPLLTEAQQRDILSLLAHLSQPEQKALLPAVEQSKKPEVQRRKQATMCKILLLFLNQYNDELNQDVSRRFVDVGNTNAYSFACSYIGLVTKSKIHKLKLGARLGNVRPNSLGRNVVVDICQLDPQIYWS